MRTALLLRLRLSITLLAMILGVASQTATAYASGYPDNDAVDCSARYGIYSWCKNDTWVSSRGYGYRNCTDYVAWKLQSLGVPASKTSGLGNGGDWYDRAAAKGLDRGTTPRYGAAAVITGGLGHVAFVEAVHSNGTITVSEYNNKGDGNGGWRTDTPARLGFSRYVYFDVSGGGGGQKGSNLTF